MRKITVIFLALFTAACANNNLSDMSKGEALGAGLGAVAGGIVGYQFGAGIGQILYTTVGAVAGAGGGYMVGRRLDASDQAVYNKSAKQALSSSMDGGSVAWTNPDTGSSGIFRPTRSFRSAGNDYSCREYRAVVALEKDVLKGGGTACLLADGEWWAFDNGAG